ncbi:uncharacterized protein LOC128042904 [Gossypium raimondii]|uniref:uncharacterized protein LOC128042904 n=1 Tax=Gossypium raimondii TaxID=29730 RepID=UPI00227AA8FB|nr:uncharacterized protein LOC128042904 [Gossypium raimondii]
MNIVVDALSRKSLFALRIMNTSLALSDDGSILVELRARPLFLQQICEAQKNNSELQAKRAQCELGDDLDFRIRSDDCLMFRDRICVPRDDELIQKILHEAHSGGLSVHPGSTKMYNDLKTLYWWPSMKKDSSEFVSRCLICQQVKAEHQVPSGLLQPVMVPEWKWDRITLDFVTAWENNRIKTFEPIAEANEKALTGSIVSELDMMIVVLLEQKENDSIKDLVECDMEHFLERGSVE